VAVPPQQAWPLAPQASQVAPLQRAPGPVQVPPAPPSVPPQQAWLTAPHVPFWQEPLMHIPLVPLP
jgi:hypothetical protein